MNSLKEETVFGRQAVIAALLASRDTGVEITEVKLRPEAEAVADAFSAPPISPRLMAGLLRLFDLICIAFIGLAVHAIYVAPATGLDVWYTASLGLIPAFAVLFLQASGAYGLAALRSTMVQLGRMLMAWTLVFAGFALVVFFLKSGDQFSRVWFGTWYLTGLFFFVATRPLLVMRVRQWTRDGRLQRRAVVVGGGKPAAELIEALERQPDNDIAICGIFDDRSDERSPEMVAGYPRLGTIAELVTFCRRARIDILIVSLPLTAETRLIGMLKKLWVLPVDIRLSAQSNRLRFRPRSYSYVGAVPFLDVIDKPIADWDAIVKRVFDVVVGSLLIVLLSPVFLATAIAVKLDSPGPIFFRQKRYGFNNEIIEVFKFRSMFHNMADPQARKMVTRGDPRVTRVGRFIRRTSIDELPQLFNVLRGQLSLVGPRPHAVGAHTFNRLYEQIVDDYFARHRVRPGVTGWAQINGLRGEPDAADKIVRRTEFDLHYIEHWSVLFDLYIVLATPFAMMKSQNAF